MQYYDVDFEVDHDNPFQDSRMDVYDHDNPVDDDNQEQIQAIVTNRGEYDLVVVSANHQKDNQGDALQAPARL